MTSDPGPLYALLNVAALLSMSILHAQEVDPKDPAVIAQALSHAEAVVVGTFKINCVPWFDGWHCNGRIAVEEKLFGDHIKHGDTLPFHWNEQFGRSCFFCDQLSRFGGERGIWFLTVENGEWKFSGTPGIWCGGPLSLDARNAVVEGVHRKLGPIIHR